METKTDIRVGVSLPLVIASLVVVILAVAISLHYRANRGNGGTRNSATITSEPNTPSILPEKDSDGDGLKDWEEILWNTDPNNADTDGDGTGDGEEVTSGRKPLTPGPGDEREIFTKSTLPAPADTPTAPENLTATERLARDIFTRYSNLKQFGELDISAIEGLAASALSSNVPVIPTIRPHTLSDLSIVQENTSALQTYKTQMEYILFQPDNKLENELSIFTGILENPANRANGINTLHEIRNRYEDSEHALLAMNVPSTVATHHLDLVNIAANLKVNTTLLITALDDPVLGISGVKNYESALVEAQNAILGLNTIFASEGITTIEAS